MASPVGLRHRARHPDLPQQRLEWKSERLFAVSQHVLKPPDGKDRIVVRIAENGARSSNKRQTRGLVGDGNPAKVQRVGAVPGMIAVQAARHPQQLVGCNPPPRIAGALPLGNRRGRRNVDQPLLNGSPDDAAGNAFPDRPGPLR